MEGTKKILKKYFTLTRNNIEPKKREQLNNNLLSNMMKLLDYSVIKKLFIHIYLSSSQEVDTNKFIKYMFTKYPNVKLFVSKYNKTTNTLNVSKLFKYSKTKIDMYGKILLTNYKLTTRTVFDLIFVPVLVCDGVGHRVGFNENSYDKFLLDKKAVKVGLCYYDPIKRIIDVENHNIKMDILITPNKIHHFGEN